jgi:hypothetical protein
MENKSKLELLKHIEINKIWLESEPDITEKKLAQISEDFLLHSCDTEDFRFLNTALKLNDRLRSKDGLPEELEDLENRAISELMKFVGL